ncbi:MAG: hypothetical protein JRN10_00220 [Nitrososphaerota archaeon]|jgi:hypothetical protein|nr:hypothetical protein [Nitrososphaerota archaeon]MDG6929662.1 hypothetical protein [Nitrososphaerota archaeon]
MVANFQLNKSEKRVRDLYISSTVLAVFVGIIFVFLAALFLYIDNNADAFFSYTIGLSLIALGYVFYTLADAVVVNAKLDRIGQALGVWEISEKKHNKLIEFFEMPIKSITSEPSNLLKKKTLFVFYITLTMFIVFIMLGVIAIYIWHLGLDISAAYIAISVSYFIAAISVLFTVGTALRLEKQCADNKYNYETD